MTPKTYTHQWYQFCPHCRAKLSVDDKGIAKCPVCPFVFYNNPVPAVTILIEQNRKLLLALRKFDPQKDLWDMVGGFSNPGESIEATVIRETKEETDLDVKIIRYLGSTHDLYDLMPTLNSVFLVEIISGTPKALDDVKELRWFNLDEIPEKQSLAFANTIFSIDQYKKFLKES